METITKKQYKIVERLVLNDLIEYITNYTKEYTKDDKINNYNLWISLNSLISKEYFKTMKEYLKQYEKNPACIYLIDYKNLKIELEKILKNWEVV